MVYDKNTVEKVLLNLRQGLETGKFIYWNEDKNMFSGEVKVATEVQQEQELQLPSEKVNKISMMSNNTQEQQQTTNSNTPSRRGRPVIIDNKDFIKIWESSASLQDVVKSLSTLKQFDGSPANKIKLYASTRATSLRKSVPLKEFKRGRRSKLKVLAE